MQEMSGCEFSLDMMRAKRAVAEAVYKKFTEAVDYHATYAFCFYEGEDGKYYNPRIKSIWGKRFITLEPGNKQAVIKTMQLIQANPLYKEVCLMFFVDRDYDAPLAGTNKDLFETPCYSVENLYAQQTVLEQILQAEFGLNVIDEDFQKCITDYQARIEEFNKEIMRFNALVRYQHEYAPEIPCNFSSIKTSCFARISLDKVSRASKYHEKITMLMEKLKVDAETIDAIEESLCSMPALSYVLRGKNQLDFFVKFVSLLKEQHQNGEYFSAKKNHVYLTLSANRLSELSQYANTPSELIVFLQAHLPQQLA